MTDISGFKEAFDDFYNTAHEITVNYTRETKARANIPSSNLKLFKNILSEVQWSMVCECFLLFDEKGDYFFENLSGCVSDELTKGKLYENLGEKGHRIFFEEGPYLPKHSIWLSSLLKQALFLSNLDQESASTCFEDYPDHLIYKFVKILKYCYDHDPNQDLAEESKEHAKKLTTLIEEYDQYFEALADAESETSNVVTTTEAPASTPSTNNFGDIFGMVSQLVNNMLPETEETAPIKSTLDGMFSKLQNPDRPPLENIKDLLQGGELQKIAGDLFGGSEHLFGNLNGPEKSEVPTETTTTDGPTKEDSKSPPLIDFSTEPETSETTE